MPSPGFRALHWRVTGRAVKGAVREGEASVESVLGSFYRTEHGTHKENLGGKEIQVKGSDFAKFFVLPFLPSASSGTGRH